KLPFVLIARYLPDSDVDYVGADNVAGAEMALDHLLALGHRRIAFLGGPSDSSARHDRVTGYRNALERHGVMPDEMLSITSPVTREGGYAALLDLLDLPEPPTAALCYNDVVAFGTMLSLQAAGRAPGQDFAIVGFDDIADAALVHPALTTVSISPRIGDNLSYFTDCQGQAGPYFHLVYRAHAFVVFFAFASLHRGLGSPEPTNTPPDRWPRPAPRPA
ncbi:MAG: substrate-binding domain-containing protein, partial [Rhodothermales bacterium]